MGIFVWWKNKKNPVNIFFFFMCFFTVGWMVFVLLFSAERESNYRGFIFAKLLYLFVAFAVISIPIFSFIYPIGFEKHVKIKM